MAIPNHAQSRAATPTKRTTMPNDEIEKLSAKLHVIYQEEAKRQGDLRHEDVYEELEDNLKEFFRAQARYILDHYVKR
jgi:hypothetical protein